MEDKPMKSLPSIGELFQKSWALFRDRLGLLILQMLFMVAMSFAVYIPFMIAYMVFLGATFGSAASGDVNFAGMAAGGVVLFILYIVTIVALLVVNSWIGAAMIEAVVAKQKPGFKAALKTGWKHVWSYLWITVLMGIIVYGAFGLFIIPGIYLAVGFGFAAYVLIAEKAKGFGALMRSKDLVAGNWWGVFGREILLGLVFLAGYIVSMLIMLSTDSVAVMIIGFLLYVAWIILFVPYAMCFSAELYHELVGVKGVHPPVIEGRKGKYAAVTIGGYVLMILLVAIPVGWALKNAPDFSSSTTFESDFATEAGLGAPAYEDLTPEEQAELEEFRKALMELEAELGDIEIE